MKQALEGLFCTKKLEDVETVEPFILNRFLSFNRVFINQADEINKYSFWCNKRILNGLLLTSTPRFKTPPFLKYIKKKEEKVHDMAFLLDKIQKYYDWGSKDMELHLSILLKMFEDKEKLKEFFRFFGIEKKYYKKFDIEFKKKEVGLNKSFGG